jgi:co-chaperonin GroES (HSP10)
MNKETTEDKRLKIKEEHLCFVPCNNLVLCKVEVIDGFDKSRGFFTGNTSWDNSGGTITRYGQIIALPKKLKFLNKPKGFGIEWTTTIEAKVGDIAFWGIMEGANCPVLSVGDANYYLVNYGEIRLLKRGEEIIPVNGFVLLEEVIKEQEGIFIAPESFKKTDKRRGIVRYLGKRNLRYYPDEHQRDPVDIKVGDEVLFKAPILTDLEDSRYAGLQQNIAYVQGRWITCKL